MKKEKFLHKYRFLIASVLTVVLFIAVWAFIVETGFVSTKYLPSPTQILDTFVQKLSDPKPEGSTLGANILSSVKVASVGFLLAVVLGITLGLFMGWYTPLEKFVKPVFEIIRPIPPVAWIPITIMLFGIGFKAKAFIIFFGGFIPCVINAYTGIQLTNRTLINVAKTYGADSWKIFWAVGLPSSVQMIFAGVRIALGVSWMTLVAAEMLAADSGLGYMILMGRQFARPDIIVLGMLIIGGIGALLSVVLMRLERKNRTLEDEKMTENPEKITPAKKAFYAFLSVLAIVLLLVGWMLIARVRPYLFPESCRRVATLFVDSRKAHRPVSSVYPYSGQPQARGDRSDFRQFFRCDSGCSSGLEQVVFCHDGGSV